MGTHGGRSALRVDLAYLFLLIDAASVASAAYLAHLGTVLDELAASTVWPVTKTKPAGAVAFRVGNTTRRSGL